MAEDSGDRKCIIELIESEISSKAVVELLEREDSENKLVESGEVVKSGVGAKQSRVCPSCGSPLYHISLTDEYYCFTCKRYA